MPATSKPVLRLEFEDETCDFFVQASQDQRTFMLCVVVNRPMSNADLLQALELFVQDAKDSQTPLIGNADSTGGEN